MARGLRHRRALRRRARVDFAGQTGKTLDLRAGLRVDALFGTETPEDETLGVEQSFTNMQVLLEFQLGFRFAGP